MDAREASRVFVELGMRRLFAIRASVGNIHISQQRQRSFNGKPKAMV
jgi:hypothetical protein